MSEAVSAGTDVPPGTYRCSGCEQIVTTVAVLSLGRCPRCGGEHWRRMGLGGRVERP